MQRAQTKKLTTLPKATNKTKGPKKQALELKLSEDMEKEIKEAFDFYDNERNGFITRGHLKSILGNFGFQNQNAKEIEQELEEKNEYDSSKQAFTFSETIEIIARKWFLGNGKDADGKFLGNGKDAEADEIYKIFDRKDKNAVGLNEIRQVFHQFLDIQISDEDILEYIEECDLNNDGVLDKNEFCLKLGYI